MTSHKPSRASTKIKNLGNWETKTVVLGCLECKNHFNYLSNNFYNNVHVMLPTCYTYIIFFKLQLQLQLHLLSFTAKQTFPCILPLTAVSSRMLQYLPLPLFLVFALKLIPFSQHPWLSSESYASLVLNFCLSLMLSSCSSKISSSSLFHLVFSLESFLQSYSICSTVPNNLLESFHPIYTIPCRSVYIYTKKLHKKIRLKSWGKNFLIQNFRRK